MEMEHEVFDGFPYGILVFDRERRLVRTNRAGHLFLGHLIGGDDGTDTCCSILGCYRAGTPLADACLTQLLAERDEVLPEFRIDVAGGQHVSALWVTASLLPDRSRLVVSLRPGEARDRRRRSEPHWMAGPHLHVRALGRTRVESPEGPIGGRWLEGRPGQIFKYLLCERHRVVPTDEIGERIWPGSDFTVRNSVRHFIHALRDRLEPTRPKRAPSAFVVSVQGGYTLDLDRITVDADEFERRVREGLSTTLETPERRIASLNAAMEMYHGDFLSDEPYAEWALAERDRLRSQASEALRALTRHALNENDTDAASRFADRLARFQPFDMDVQRHALALCLARGRRSEAVRRYAALRERLHREFEEEPDFRLSDVRQEEALVS